MAQGLGTSVLCPVEGLVEDPRESTCPPPALVGERQDQPHSGKMDEPESRFWERESSDGGEDGPTAEDSERGI
ncbi:unnamed protein product [Rangifer tarandus platyrhynchus]|uniref:Uncharacterized protein n=1 Tax=Rangifer tarandus platyrhynchus TaxID=3082113 RepID=A0AC59Z4D4_RANTA